MTAKFLRYVTVLQGTAYARTCAHTRRHTHAHSFTTRAHPYHFARHSGMTVSFPVTSVFSKDGLTTLISRSPGSRPAVQKPRHWLPEVGSRDLPERSSELHTLYPRPPRFELSVGRSTEFCTFNLLPREYRWFPDGPRVPARNQSSHCHSIHLVSKCF